MNKTNRSKLDAIFSELEDIKSRLDTIQDEAQDAFDAKSEKWQEGEKGERATAEIEAIEAASSALDDVMSNVETAKEEE